MTIRGARIMDGEQVVDLIRSTLPGGVKGLTPYDCTGMTSYVRESIRAMMWGGENCYFVAVKSGQVIGAIEAQVTTTELFIKYVAVAPTHRRKGLASALLLQVLTAHPEKPTVSLHVLESNAGALAWYESLEMRKLSSVYWYVGDLPRSTSTSCPLISGYPQMYAHLEKFGFGAVTLKAADRATNIGVLGETWLRFTSWDDVRDPELISALQRIWPQRRALVLAPARCPRDLNRIFSQVAEARLMQGRVAEITHRLVGRNS